jgi:MATE family multidrug resistance protein
MQATQTNKTDAGQMSPVVEMLKVAAPTVATMTSYTAMTFVDKFIVSKIGADPVYVGAQGNGGLAAWVPIAVAMGAITVINTYVSQNMGAGKPERGPAYAWNGLWIAVAYWAAVLVPFAFVLPWVFRIADVEAEQARLGAEYGRILLFGGCLTLATRAISQFFYGMHRASVVLVAGVTANVVNLVLSWVLVFGELGMPKLGVAGSAIGTVIATCVELAIPLWVFLGRDLNAKYGTRAQWRPSASHLRDILRIGWPGGLMFGNEMICWGYFMVHLVGGVGPEDQRKLQSTAGWIAHQYMSLSFMPAVGISVACTAVVGKYMGMGRPDLAAQRAWLGLKMAMVYMIFCGVLFVVFRREMVQLFIDHDTPPDVAARVIALGSMFLIATATFQAFDAVAMTLSGALRGAGDTVVPGIATVILAWTVIVGGGTLIVTYAPQVGSLGGWVAAAAYIMLLAVFLLVRFLGGAWKSKKLLRDAPIVDAAEAGPIPVAEPLGVSEA